MSYKENFETKFEEGDTVKITKRNLSNTEYDDYEKAPGDLGVYTIKATILEITEDTRGQGLKHVESSGFKEVEIRIEKVIKDVSNIDLQNLIGDTVEVFLVQPELRKEQEETGEYRYGVFERVN